MVCEADQVLITLKDSGTGIDPAHMDRIFDAFFSTKDRGMGMGLSICRSIVESHGGQLWASPQSPWNDFSPEVAECRREQSSRQLASHSVNWGGIAVKRQPGVAQGIFWTFFPETTRE